MHGGTSSYLKILCKMYWRAWKVDTSLFFSIYAYRCPVNTYVIGSLMLNSSKKYVPIMKDAVHTQYAITFGEYNGKFDSEHGFSGSRIWQLWVPTEVSK